MLTHGQQVFLFFRNLPLEGKIVGVHTVSGKDGIKAKYDIELTFFSEKWDSPVTSRIYNVNSKMVSTKKEDLQMLEGVERGTRNIDESFAYLKKAIRENNAEGIFEAEKNLWSNWLWLSAELNLNPESESILV